MNSFFDSFTQPQSVAVNSTNLDLPLGNTSSEAVRSLVSSNVSTIIDNGILSINSSSNGTGSLQIRYLSRIGGTLLKQNSIITVSINNSMSTNLIVSSIFLQIVPVNTSPINITGIMTNNTFTFNIPNQINTSIILFVFNTNNTFEGEQRESFNPIFTIVSGGTSSSLCGY